MSLMGQPPIRDRRSVSMVQTRTLDFHVECYESHPTFAALWFGGRVSPAVTQAVHARNHRLAVRLRQLIAEHLPAAHDQSAAPTEFLSTKPISSSSWGIGFLSSRSVRGPQRTDAWSRSVARPLPPPQLASWPVWTEERTECPTVPVE